MGWAILRIVLVIGAGVGMLMLATPDQRFGMFMIAGTAALFVVYLGVRWLIAALSGRRLAFLRIWEIK